MKKRSVAILLFLMLLTSFLITTLEIKPATTNAESDIIEVSQPKQLTTDEHHDRNPSFFIAADGTWWVFFARGRLLPAPPDPDDDRVSVGGGYDIAYLKSNDGGASWIEGTLPQISDLGTAQGAIWPAAFQDDIGTLWVFYTILGPTADVYYFNSTDGGVTWRGPTATGIKNLKSVTNHHMDAVWWNGKIWVILALDKVYAFNSADGMSWNGPYLVSDASLAWVATPRVMVDDSVIRVIYFSSSGVYISSSNDGMSWINIFVTASGVTDFDPALVKVDDTYHVFWAPAYEIPTPVHWHQWIMRTTSTDLSIWSNPKNVTSGQYGEVKWWDYWSEPANTPSGLVLFYSSLKNGTTWGDSNIFMLQVDWDPNRNHYEAIQPAIDKAIPGDTIIVHAGTYDEQVVIPKSLTLQGVGDTTIVKLSSADKLSTVLSGHFWGGTKQIAGIIVANAAGGSVTVKNLKVDGEGVTARPSGADYVAGIFYRETGGTIDSVIVTGITIGTTGTAVRGYGIYLSAITNTVSVEVKGSTITNYDKNGIDAHGNKLTVNIHHNTITGRGPLLSGDEVQNGIIIMDGATGTVNTNTISNMAYIPETWWSAGIMFLDSGGSAIGNTITDCQIGIIFQDGSGSAQGNTVTGGTVGLLGIWAQYTKEGTWTATFVGNTISGARDSPGYENGAIGAQCWNEGALITLIIDNNQIIGDGSTSADGIYIGDILEYEPAGSITATITNNNISDWQHGIRLVSSVTEATITGNTIKNNLAADSGIHIEPAITATNVHVNYNNIFGNNATGVYGIFNNGIGTLDARYNWWGHPTGPYHPEMNPSGKGDKISNNIDFEPWLLEPYPPPIPVETLLYIDPAKIEYWTVAYGETFPVSVKIDEVTNLAGYEFKLYWDTSLLDLVNIEITPPWPEGNYIIAKNYTDESVGLYWLGVGSYMTGPFTGSTTVAILTFIITYNPIYPENATCTLDLKDTKLSAPAGEPIYHIVHDGKYNIYSTKPKIEVEPSTYIAHAYEEVFTVEIHVLDIVDLYNYTFKLSYDTTLLDAEDLEIGPFLNPPLYIYKFIIDDANGEICLWVWSTSGTPVTGSGALAIITFKVTKATTWTKYNPNILECAFDLHDTLLVTDKGIEVPHDVIDGLYRYEPKPGDLDCDGHVGLTDLRTVAYYYDPAYNPIADLNEDRVVDIYDLQIVAYYYGEDC